MKTSNTQGQLRTALIGRAEQSRAELDRAEAVIAATLHRARQRPHSRHRRTVLTGAAAAAAVAALVVIPTIVRSAPTNAPAAAAPAFDHLTGPVGRSTTPNTRTSRTTEPTPATAKAAPAYPASKPLKPQASDGSVTSTAVTNLIGVGIVRSINWDLRTDAEYLTVQMPGNTHASVTAFAPAAKFDQSRISAAQPMTIAGKRAWFGNISDWPANGRPDPVSGKQDGPVPSVAWQIGTTWVVVQSDDPSIQGAAAVADLVVSLRITDRPPTLRLPFTVGYLPKDLTVSSMEFYQPTNGDSFHPRSRVTLAAGPTSLSLSLVAKSETFDTDPAGGATQLTRTANGFVLQVSGTHLTPQQLTQTLKGTSVAAQPAGSAANWATLRTALP